MKEILLVPPLKSRFRVIQALSKARLKALSVALLAMTGCTSHLIFVEEDHVGLKAKFEGNNPAPAQFSLGYRRGVVAVIPQQSNGAKPSPAVSVTRTNGDDGEIITITTDPNELMSLYTVFKANVGFGDPVRIHHFLATGAAATSLLSNNDDLRSITEAVKDPDESKGGSQ